MANIFIEKKRKCVIMVNEEMRTPVRYLRKD